MDLSTNTVESRREFFRAAARYGLLGALAVAGILTARRSIGSDGKCLNRGICGNCAQFAACNLPAALSARKQNRQA